MLVLLLLSSLLITSTIAFNGEFASQQFHNKSEHIKPNYIQEGTFRTRLNHFLPQDERTFEMSYDYNDIYFEFNGPVFIYIKDSEEYTTQWIEEGLMVDIAQDVGGLLCTIDRRYMGRNIPANIENASFENLQYLTVEQELSDIAFFITHIKNTFPTYYSKFILWGSGYGGTVAAWARKKYPHLIEAAWSSSGIFQFRATSESFYDLLSTTIRFDGPPGCAEDVEFAFNVMEFMIEQGDGEYLQETLNLCHPVDTTNANAVAMFIEIQLHFISNYISNFHIFGVQDFCRDMNHFENDAFTSYARWVQFVYGANIECFLADFDEIMEIYSVAEWNVPGTGTYAGRQLFYEQCTQIGFRGTASEYSLFPQLITDEFHFNACQTIFGEEYVYYLLHEALYDLTIQYSTVNPATTQIIYSNGMLDPYLYQGIFSTPQPASYVLNIPYHARSADLTSIVGWEPTVLTATKQRITEIIKLWLWI